MAPMVPPMVETRVRMPMWRMPMGTPPCCGNLSQRRLTHVAGHVIEGLLGDIPMMPSMVPPVEPRVWMPMRAHPWVGMPMRTPPRCSGLNQRCLIHVAGGVLGDLLRDIPVVPMVPMAPMVPPMVETRVRMPMWRMPMGTPPCCGNLSQRRLTHVAGRILRGLLGDIPMMPMAPVTPMMPSMVPPVEPGVRMPMRTPPLCCGLSQRHLTSVA